MGNALEIKNLTKKFNDFQLDNVSLTLPEGCIMGFIGENGAGKSTTIKLILGLLHRDGGDISVLGKDFRKSGAGLREEIGVVMDESNFPANLSLKDVNSIMKNCYKTWNSEKFLAFAHQFNLPDKKTVKDYSRGMKMKLSIAVALSHASRLLILDEATSGLDVNMEIDPAVNRDGGVLDYCRLNGITIQPWSPFQYGFFEGTFIDCEKFKPLNDCLEKIANKYGADKTAVVIAWLLRHPARFQPVTGTMNEGRLKSCIRGTEIKLTREEWYEIYLSAGNKLP